MHVAFLQQETLDFEQVGFMDASADGSTAGQGFSAEGDEEFEGRHEDGDDEFEFSSSSESSTLGDVRIFIETKDDEEEEEDEDAKKKRRQRRRLQWTWGRTSATTTNRATETTGSRTSTGTSRTGRGSTTTTTPVPAEDDFLPLSGDEADIDGPAVTIDTTTPSQEGAAAADPTLSTNTNDSSTQFSQWQWGDTSVDSGTRSGRSSVTNDRTPSGGGRNSGTTNRDSRTSGNVDTGSGRADGDRTNDNAEDRSVSESDEIIYICETLTDTDVTSQAEESDQCFDPAIHCPASLDALSDITYIVKQDAAVTRSISDFSVSFPFCPLVYTYTVTLNGVEATGIDVIQFDGTTRTFTVFWDQGIDFTDGTSAGNNYVVTVTGTGPRWGRRDVTTQQTVYRTAQFNVNVKSPCFERDTIVMNTEIKFPTSPFLY